MSSHCHYVSLNFKAMTSPSKPSRRKRGKSAGAGSVAVTSVVAKADLKPKGQSKIVKIASTAPPSTLVKLGRLLGWSSKNDDMEPALVEESDSRTRTEKHRSALDTHNEITPKRGAHPATPTRTQKPLMQAPTPLSSRSGRRIKPVHMLTYDVLGGENKLMQIEMNSMIDAIRPSCNPPKIHLTTGVKNGAFHRLNKRRFGPRVSVLVWAVAIGCLFADPAVFERMIDTGVSYMASRWEMIQGAVDCVLL